MDNLAIGVGGAGEAPVITETAAKTNFLFLTWTATPTRAYQLQACTNLVNPDWQDLGPRITATNDFVSYSEPLTPGNRYYRVELLSP